MISSFFQRGRFALALRAARSLLGGDTGLEQPREPYMQGVTASSAVICWVSGHPGSGVVEYGKTPELGRKESDSRVRRRHAVALAGLDPGSTYHYRVGGVVESPSKGSLRTGREEVYAGGRPEALPAEEVDRGANLFLVGPKQEAEQGLRASAGERRSLHLRCYEPPDGEEIGSLVRVFRQFHGEFSKVAPLLIARHTCPHCKKWRGFT
jgi:hypothetical protein